ncbi:MAG: type II toxin-antitoxin system RelE/ParE family toxin [Candidatus Omnitrophica bacterium]|nr:type II toxin-antitoxin system RelE/ParE family toxin [Candidatus Omnitrophota bacterium]
MELIETPIFTKKIMDIFSDDEYREMQWSLAINPEAGIVIPGGGGLRKLRWGASGKGKSGGVRVIYYVYARDQKIYLLYPYKKSEQEDLTRKQLRILREYIKDGVL